MLPETAIHVGFNEDAVRRATGDHSFGAFKPVVNHGSGAWRSILWWQNADNQRTRPRWRLTKPAATGQNLVLNFTTRCCMRKQGSKPKAGIKGKKDWESLPPLNRNAAGIDVGNAEHHVAVPPG
jgi:hypothetical protein